MWNYLYYQVEHLHASRTVVFKILHVLDVFDVEKL